MGGDDTALGIDFQARVAAWYATHCVCEMTPQRVGAHFPLLAIETIEAESGSDTLDDLYLVLSDGGLISVQSKMRPSLSDKKDSPLGKTISQLIHWYIQLKNNKTYQQKPDKFRAIMAVKNNTPKTLDALNEFCRFFDSAVDWNRGHDKCKNNDQKKAAKIFNTLIEQAWKSAGQTEPCIDVDKANLARLFHIVRFQLEEGQTDWNNLISLLENKLFDSDEVARNASASLLAFMNEQIQKRSVLNRALILARLRQKGHEDIYAPQYDADIKKLRNHTEQEIDNLKRHHILPLGDGDGIELARPCVQPLFEAAQKDSFFVLGEPGSGKTGTMLDLAQFAKQKGIPLVFLSVDRFADIPGMSQIESELKLDHQLSDVLQNWPGSTPGLLLIDALDATRGLGAEKYFRNLLAIVTKKLAPKWRLVASIRLFDIKNSSQLRELMPGSLECDEQYKSNEVKNTRHFLVPRLSDTELEELKGKNEKLCLVLSVAPTQTRELLRNIFNLSLVAELLQKGEIDPIQFDLKQQSSLLKYYISKRIPSDSGVAKDFKKAIEYCLENNQLNIPTNQALQLGLDQDALLSTGIMYDICGGPRRLRLLFSHHVLFDYLVAWYFFDWADFKQLQTQLSVPDRSFMLGPALSFVMEIIWFDPANNSKAKWELVFSLWRNATIDQIFKSVAVRSATVLLADVQDATALMSYAQELIQKGDIDPQKDITPVLTRMGSYFDKYCHLQRHNQETIATWEELASLATKADETFLHFSYLIMYTLSNGYYNNHSCSSFVFNETARLLLGKARTICNRSLSFLAVQCVVQSLNVSPDDSITALKQLFGDDALFEKCAHLEAFAIAQGIVNIAKQEPDFVPIIYASLFGKAIKEDETTIISGRPSELMTLTSTKKQDLDSALWMLVEKIGRLIEHDYQLGLKAINVAIISRAQLKHGNLREVSTHIGDQLIIVVEDDIWPQDWKSENASAENNDLLKPLADFLYKADQFKLTTVYEYLLKEKSCASIWARLLGVVADRQDVSLPDLWAFATEPISRQVPALLRDSIAYIKKVYSGQSAENRTNLEACLLNEAKHGEKRANGALNRFLSVIDETDLISDGAKQAKNQRAGEKQLHGNPPIVSISTSWAPIDNEVDFLLERKQNSPTENEAPLLDICRELDRCHKRFINDGVANYEEVFGLFTKLRGMFQAGFSGSENICHLIRGYLGYAIEMITFASHSNIEVPWENDIPDDIWDTITELAHDEYPKLDTDLAVGRSHVGWGLYDVRVHAAISVMQLVGVMDDDPRIINLIQQLIHDEVPAVRLQIVERLVYLQDVNSGLYLDLSKDVTEKENDPYVLALFINNIFVQLGATNPRLLMEHLSAIDHRLDEKNLQVTSDDSSFMEAMACCSAILWLRGDDELSKARLLKWADNTENGARYLKFALANLRDAFFDGYSNSADNYRASNIARKLIALWENISARLLETIGSYWSQEKIEPSGPLWEKARNAAEILDALSLELYCGSGAQSRALPTTKPLALPIDEAKKSFLNDYAIILNQLAESCQTRAIYHLIELYAFLLPSLPEDVFDKIASVITGPAQKSGFSIEPFAVKVVIDLVRTCLADHRDIFEDAGRRRKLVEVLNVFSDSGWPDAIQLLYDLPELFR